MRIKRNVFFEKTINFLLNVLIIIFGIVLLISIYTGVQTKILGNKHANFFGYSIFEVITGSMADAINPGDWVIVQHTQKPKLNDIVTYELSGEYITHRVIEVYKGTYITKGDANNAKDKPIDQKQIIGKVVTILANFGIVRRILFNPSVLIALIITIFMFNLAFKKNKEKNAKRSKIEIIVKKIINKFKGINNRKIEKNTLEFNNPMVDIRIIENLSKLEKTDKFENKGLEGTKDYYTDDNDLDKTLFYRVVPVDSEEVNDKYKNELPTKQQAEEYYTDADDLDKTSLYRIIPVDANEVNDTLVEVAENQMKNSQKNNGNTSEDDNKKGSKEEQDEKKETKENNVLTKINLDLLKSIRSKKGKNIIDKSMNIKKEELNELIEFLFMIDQIAISKPTIKERLIDTYINAKYYNCYIDSSVGYDGKTPSKIKDIIKRDAKEIINEYQGTDIKYQTLVEKYFNALVVIADLEHSNNFMVDPKAKKEFYFKIISEYFKGVNSKEVDYIIECQKKYKATLDYFLRDFETNMFSLVFNKLSTKKDVQGVELKHNIAFSKVYSEFIIEKTYNEGLIAEDKMPILLTLLSVQLVKDMLSADFKKKYIIYIPISLYAKEKKFEHTLRMIDDKYAKDNILILITINDLLVNKKFVQMIRKTSYRFALVFDVDVVLDKKERGTIYIADCIFINKKAVNEEKIKNFIPKDLHTNIIYESIVDKVGDFGGEQS